MKTLSDRLERTPWQPKRTMYPSHTVRREASLCKQLVLEDGEGVSECVRHGRIGGQSPESRTPRSALRPLIPDLCPLVPYPRAVQIEPTAADSSTALGSEPSGNGFAAPSPKLPSVAPVRKHPLLLLLKQVGSRFAPSRLSSLAPQRLQFRSRPSGLLI